MERILKDTLLEGRFSDVSPVNSRRMSAVKSKGNRTTEKRFRASLVARGINGWKMHPKSLVGSPDFFFPESSLAVFVDGCFWHGCPRCGHIPKQNNLYWQTKLRRNKERDIKKIVALEDMGIQVIRFWEHDIKSDLSGCLQKLNNKLQAVSR